MQALLAKEKFFTIYLDVGDVLDLANIDYLDILMSIAYATEKQVRSACYQINSTLMEELYNWFAEKTSIQLEKHDKELGVGSQAGIGTKIPLLGELFANITSQLSSGSSQRDEIRITFKREWTVFIERLNKLIAEARRQVQQSAAKLKDIVIIVDGLEKMFYDLKNGESTHSILFVQHAEQLKAPECHIIYTVPISLAFNTNLSNAFGMDTTPVIPMVKLDKAGKGRERFIELVEKRINIDKVFDTPARDLVAQLVEMSGGAVRDLMRLVRLACQSTDGPLTQANVQRAIHALVRDYDRFILDKDIEALRLVDKQHRVTGDEKYSRLLHISLIHEYQNDERWADLHPVVRQIRWVSNCP